MWKVLAGILLAVSVLFASVQWVLLYNTLADALAAPGLGVVEGLGLGHPDTEQAAASALRGLAGPRALLQVYGAAQLLLLLGVAAVVVVVWSRTDLRSEGLGGRILFSVLIGLPTIVGLGALAGPGARTSVQNLSQAGLTNPHLVGGAMAAVYGMVILGAMLGVGLAAVYFGLLRS